MNSLLLHYRCKNSKMLEGSFTKCPKLEKELNIEHPSTSFFFDNFAHDQLELFHFIGKIMYAKRAGKTTEQWQNNEAKLNPNFQRKYGRPYPPKDDLNWLIDTSPMSAQLLSSYLFEHQPRFGPSIHSIASIQQLLSHLDVLVESNYEQRSQMEKYMIDLSVRASLFHNYRPSIDGDKQKRRFYQFEKPRLYDLRMQKMEIKSSIASLYPIGRTSDMTTLLLPLLPRISSICINQNQAELLEKLSLSSKRFFRLKISELSDIPNSSLQNKQIITTRSEEESKMTEILFDNSFQEEKENNSLNASFNSFYSISSRYDDDDGQENDGFCYDINEDEN